jgi:hypothetical protein
LIEKFLNSKPSGEDAYWSEKLSKVYTWKELIALIFEVCNNKTKDQKPLWILPIPSENTVYISLDEKKKMTRVTSFKVSLGETFLVDYNRGLQAMGNEPEEVEGVNMKWTFLQDESKSYEKLVELSKLNFFP